MQDVKLLERAIRVGRPTNTDQYQEIMDSTIEKSKNQPILYISNIHSAVVEDDLRDRVRHFYDFYYILVGKGCSGFSKISCFLERILTEYKETGLRILRFLKTSFLRELLKC